jgi:CheY-like chemotaxis protein
MPGNSIQGTRKSSIQEPEQAFVAQSGTVLAGKCCLVVDDELLIALDIEQILLAASAAYVACFADAAEALAALRSGSRFDVAVLDVLLRGTTRDSFSVAAALQLQNTPFVFLTGMRGVDLRPGEFPAVPVVEKPCPSRRSWSKLWSTHSRRAERQAAAYHSSITCRAGLVRRTLSSSSLCTRRTEMMWCWPPDCGSLLVSTIVSSPLVQSTVPTCLPSEPSTSMCSLMS